MMVFLLMEKDGVGYAVEAERVERIVDCQEESVPEEVITPLSETRTGRFVIFCMREGSITAYPADVVKGIFQIDRIHELPDEVKTARNQIFLAGAVVKNEAVYFLLS